MTEIIFLLLVDDHTLVRSGIRRILEEADDLIVVAEAGSVSQAMEKVKQHHPTVSLIDAQLPDGNGMEACRLIRAQFVDTYVVILSTFDRDIFLARAYAAGAAGFVVKAAERDELIQIVRVAAQGKRAFTTDQMQRILNWQREIESRLRTLTLREQEVLKLIAAGHSNSQIASRLVVSIKTVECHVSRILDKLEFVSRRDVIIWVDQTGILLA